MATTTPFEARERLAEDLRAIAGVRRVYETFAEQMPESPDLPCFVLDVRDPFFSITGGAVGQTEDTLYLSLTFLFKAQGQGKPIENIQAIERFLILTKQKLYANFTGGGLYLINKDTRTMAFSGYLLGKENAPVGTRYWGFDGTLDLTMFVDTTMSAGS